MVAEPMFIERPTARKIWTYDEIAHIDDDVRRELYDGEIFRMPSPNSLHQIIILNLAFLLKFYAQNHGGRAFISPVDLWVSPTRYFIPDLIFYGAARSDLAQIVPDGQRFTLAPDLVVEVLSPSTARNDRIEKTRAYAEFGVANYWILDPLAKTLEAFELRESLYFLANALDETQTFAPANFPELSMDLARVFED